MLSCDVDLLAVQVLFYCVIYGWQHFYSVGRKTGTYLSVVSRAYNDTEQRLVY